MASLPDEIERVALLGWHVFPRMPRHRAACFEGASSAATCDLDQLATWWREYPGCGWCVVFGPSELWGIDLDRPPRHKHDGVANFATLAAQHEPIPPRPTLRSGGGGLAIFFQHHGEAIQGRDGVPAPGCDPRRGRQTQTIPPSRHHATGLPYRWAVAPWEVSAPVAPAWLLEAVRPPPEPPRAAVERPADPTKARHYAIGALRQATRKVAALGKGGRNNVLNGEAYSLARFVKSGDITESELRDCLSAAARANGLAAEDGTRAVLATIDSGLHAGLARL